MKISMGNVWSWHTFERSFSLVGRKKKNLFLGFPFKAFRFHPWKHVIKIFLLGDNWGENRNSQPSSFSWNTFLVQLWVHAPKPLERQWWVFALTGLCCPIRWCITAPVSAVLIRLGVCFYPFYNLQVEASCCAWWDGLDKSRSCLGWS